MNKSGHITCQIKNPALQKKYKAAIQSMGIPESEFIRLSLRNMIQIVEKTGSMPQIDGVNQ
jgi:spore coat protein CotF